MKKKAMSILLCLVMVLQIITSRNNMVDIQAANVKVKSDQDSFAFAVPEGGWSTITVYVNYIERYTKKEDSKNKFYNREIFYAYKTSYATTRPKFKLLNNIQHVNKNGKTLHTFKIWNKCDAMADGSWEYFTALKNAKNFTYKNTTANKAVINYQTTCDMAVVPVRGKTIKMNLNTK